MALNQNMIRMTCFNPINKFQNLNQNNSIQQAEQQQLDVLNQLSSDIKQSKKRMSSGKKEENKQTISLMQQIQKPESIDLKRKIDVQSQLINYDDLEEENVQHYNQPKKRKVSPAKIQETKVVQAQAPANAVQFKPFQIPEQKQEKTKTGWESFYKETEEMKKANENLIEEQNRNQHKIQQEFQSIQKNVQEYLQKHKFVERQQYNNLAKQYEQLKLESEQCSRILEEKQKQIQDYEMVQKHYNPYLAQLLNVLKSMKAVESIQCITQRQENSSLSQEESEKFLVKIQYKSYYIEFTLTLKSGVVTYDLVKKNENLQLYSILNETQVFQEQDLNQFAMYIVDQIISWNKF